jgi:2,3-bisphosphoglycerate-dependent phosphoglycerate mutase
VRLFVLVRHGQSVLNVAGVVNGDPALDLGLSEPGVEQAKQLADQLAQLPVDLLVVSPFPRAVQTAEIALQGRDVSREVDPELGDVRIGELEGGSLDDYRHSEPHSDRDVPFPGGESLNDAARRYAGAFRRLCDRAERTTLVVCHEIPVRYAVNAARGSLQLDAPLHDVGNATPYVFDEAALRRAAAQIAVLAG